MGVGSVFGLAVRLCVGGCVTICLRFNASVQTFFESSAKQMSLCSKKQNYWFIQGKIFIFRPTNQNSLASNSERKGFKAGLKITKLQDVIFRRSEMAKM